MVEAANPKLAGSNIIDCIPQTGECPMGCPECFYNGGRFYRTLDKSLVPTVAESHGKIVRMNCGHDSNLEKDKVLHVAGQYEHVFFNTSLLPLDFPGPVVFTCNAKKPHFIECPGNVMFVRVRANTWDADQGALVRHYHKQGIPVVITFMRYYSEDSIPKDRLGDFVFSTNITNKYWKMTKEAERAQMEFYKGMGVRRCGTDASSLCVDCRNCEILYWECLRRMGK